MKSPFCFRIAAGVLCVLLFNVGDQFARGQSLTSPPIPFKVGFFYPTNGQRYTAPANVGPHAEVEDSNFVKTVQYFSGTTSIGTVTNASNVLLTNLTQANPFFLAWSNVPAGTYVLTAVATDAAGASATSAPVTIYVTNPPPPKPAVYIYSPTNNAKYSAPTNLTLYARAVESGGTVATVTFVANSNILGVVSNISQAVYTNISSEPLFALPWTNVAAGNYALTAIATDLLGNSTTSTVVNISVTNPPPPPKPAVYIYSPTNNAKYTAPTNLTLYARAVESGGTVATVTFVANSNILGVVSNISQAVYTNISSEPLFALPWTNVAAGNYALTAIATDLLGNSTTSTVVNISVTNPPPPPKPAVYIYSPTNNAKYTAPTNLTLYARAVESGGTVATVTFVANSNILGVVSNISQAVYTNISSEPLFALPWTNVAAGNYALTAIATDLLGNSTTSTLVNISVTNPPPPPKPAVYIYSPTNNAKYTAPTNLTLYARAVESGGTVATVTFVANSNILGVVSNISQAVYTNISSEPLFALPWTNVAAGNYALTAIATDLLGNSTTSTLVNISVTNPPPPPKPAVYIYSPTNNAKYTAPTNLTLYARAVESGGTVATVTFVANSNILGVVSNISQAVYTNISSEPLFALPWTNVAAGNYALTAIATDLLGNSTTSTLVNISVTNPPPPPPPVPFYVGFYYPTNGETFTAPASIGVHALVTDSNVVKSVQYFAGTTSIGIVSNTSTVLLTNSTQANPFFLSWSNVPVGTYTLTAVATDSACAKATSAPVTIFVLAPPPPVVTIYAPDPVAIEGTNCDCWYTPTNLFTNYCTGSNTATFLVRRSSGTNSALTVYYSIGGTATNGVGYKTIPGSVIIPAGSNYALITIVPLEDNDDSTSNHYDTVLLSLLAPPTSFNSPATYSVGSPSKAGVVILEDYLVPITTPQIRNFADGSVHTSLPAPNGLIYCVESSANLVNWLPVCTNIVLKGSAQYVDPSAGGTPSLFYRIVSSSTPPNY